MTQTMKDKIVVITGSTRGYGYAFAEAMLKAGATVYVIAKIYNHPIVTGLNEQKLFPAPVAISD